MYYVQRHKTICEDKMLFPIINIFITRSFYSYGIDVDADYELGQIHLRAQNFRKTHSRNIDANSSVRYEYEASTIHA